MVYTLADGTQMTRRTRIILTGAVSGALSDYQLKLAAAYAAAMQNNFNDLRFTQADMQTLIDAWLEDKSDGVSADVWSEFPTTPANGVDQDYYMYYGNAGAASDWGGAATFEFFDGFEGTSLNTVPTSGDVTVSAIAGEYEAWPGIAKDSSGNLYAVYTHSTEDIHGWHAGKKVVIKKSTDNGQTWGSEVTIYDSATTDDRNTGILIFDDNGTETILVAFDRQYTVSSNDRTYIKKSTDGGQTWGSLIELSPGNQRYVTYNKPIMLSNGKILLALMTLPVSGGQFVVESDDGGDTWTEYTLSSSYGCECTLIEIKTGGSFTGGVYAIVRDQTSPYAYKKSTSTDYGHTWTAWSDITDIPASNHTPIDLLRLSNDHIVAAYTNDWTDKDLLLYESDDECQTWNPKSTLVTGLSGSYYPRIEIINSSKLIIIWCTNGNPGSDVYISFIDYPLMSRWIVDSGAVTVADSKVTLDGTDVIRDQLLRSKPFAMRTKIDLNSAEVIVFGASKNTGNTWNQDSFSFQTWSGNLCPTTYNNGSASQDCSDPVTTGWRICDMKWKTGEVQFDYEGSNIYSPTANIPDEDLYIKVDNRTGSCDVDWILLRKYVDNPPTYAFGTEEHQRRTPQFM